MARTGFRLVLATVFGASGVHALRALIAALLAVPLAALHAAEFWVATSGNDRAPGSQEQPFATPERARDAVRKLKQSGKFPAEGVTVWLQPGQYMRQRTFELTAEDSGTERAPIWYRAAGGEVCWHAGRLLASADFHPLTDTAVVKRLDPAARGNVYGVLLAPLGLKHGGPFPRIFNDGGGLFELYFGGRRMPLARWPNTGNATMAQVLDRGDWSKDVSRHGGTFVANEDRVARWNVLGGVWLEGYWRVPWDPQAVLVKSIDSAQRRITLAEPVNGGIGSKYAPRGQLGDGQEPWCAVNLLEEIDRPGEWCVDFPSGTLYFWPPAPLDTATVFVSDFDRPLVLLNGASYVQLQGLTLEGGLAGGVEIRGGAGNIVLGCVLRNLGGSGVVVKGGTHNGVRSSDLYALGQAGVQLTGGERATLTPCSNFADNNHLHHLGIRKKTYAAAIHIGAYCDGDAVGCRVAHNLIHDLPHAGVLYGGNDHLLEFNEIFRVVLTSADMGAFYTTHDWTSRGNTVRYNFVYDSPRANAFYCDDGDSGDTVFGNVVHGLSYGPFIGGGHDNIVQNNLVIASQRGVHLDARGIARGYDADKGLLARLQSVNWRQPPWSARYPELVTILATNPAYPRGNVFEHNVTVECKQPMHLSGKPAELAFSTVRENLDLTKQEAGFMDADRGDFRLAPESPLFRKLPAFQPIPFDQIGLEKDAFRESLPKRTLTHEHTSPKGAVFDSETDVQQSNQRP